MKFIKITCSLVSFMFLLLGCDEIFFEEEIDDEVITIFAPQDGVSVDNTSVTFSWSTIENAENYQIQIVQPNFENTVSVIETTIVETNEHTTDLEIGAYAWRVKAINSNSETAYASANINVTENENFNERIVSLISPEDNFNTNQTTINFEWMPVSDTSLYRIEILNENGTVLTTETTTETSVSIATSSEITQWQVRAENDNDVTSYTTHNIVIDTEVPNTPVLTTPANNSFSTNLTNSFEWTRETLEGSAEVDSLFIFSDSSLSTLQLKQEITTGTDITLENTGDVFWLVQSFDAAGNESDESETFTFTIN